MRLRELWPISYHIQVSRIRRVPPPRRETIPSTWFYDPLAPFEVTVWFGTEDSGVEWVFSRELLAEGLHQPCGVGDVRVWPDGRAVLLQLHSPDGTSTLGLSRVSLRTFLGRTFAMVPAGAEDADVDGAIAHLLAGGAR